MIKGIYASGSGMVPRMMKLEVIANNLANISTTGFKRDNIFVQILKDTEVSQSKGGGDLSGLDVKEYTDFTEGSMNQTSNPLDLAIQGPGFFTVQSPTGLCYTRNGIFSLSTDGTIVTAEGYPLLGSGGPIRLPDVQKLSQGDIVVNQSGEVTYDGKIISRLRIASFTDMGSLKKEKGTYFVTTAPETGTEADGKDTVIRQGQLEESNVNGIEEMIEMIELSRSFESAQKTMLYQDGTLEKAMDVGQV
ncbi:MAG TPA: flagellar basal-body rod protein FlgF [Bacteroidota bacterium]|nr:flagellar basal-body rod protein FlgF [Bacteroidota bacterium]